MTWYTEALHDGVVDHGYAQRFQVNRVICERKTDFQELVIFETPHFGRVLALDGIIQTTQHDEFCYHEMLAHVPLFAHGVAENVLIIGGGDGGVLREVLKHPVKSATQVEIDGTVIDICREHMPFLSDGAFDDARTDLVIADGVKFVAETDRRFDVIIIDSTDPVGPGEVLFSEAFYADCKRCLSPGGILVTQNGVPLFQGQELSNSVRRLSRHFGDVSCYLTVVPTYVGGFMALGWATDDSDLRGFSADDLSPRFDGAGVSTRYYSPAVHAASFALPPFISELIG